jgi:hypothetical protein
MYALVLVVYAIWYTPNSVAQMTPAQLLPVGHFLTKEDCEKAITAFNVAADYREIKPASQTAVVLLCVASGDK